MAEVISDKQRQLNKALHENAEQFGSRDDGGGVAGKLPAALQRMHEMGICNSVLDYGTGKGRLLKRLQNKITAPIKISGYDPAVEEFSTKPEKPVDILTCLDVLEHIEMDSIDAVLDDIKNLTKQFCYLVIDLQPAVKKLADGRNAHILLAPMDWWVCKLSQRFSCVSSFPIYHQSGVPQKIVFACTQKTKILPLMYGFIIKLKIHDFTMAGGILDGMMRK
ncbi:methyltransferase domain-containing protein [Synechococcus sp. GEYO]|uniref:methyltransferase domain-containing protein n=1 Tax=Synechococcus sp. GEYO TaxID=2575511 RepID=UPI000E0FE028|nr:methyltransferase domain-containing protein [Synechococcus sp. GEYO]